LYGNVAPVTVQNLVAAVQAGAFNGTAFSKISPGEFIQLGKQGSRRLGDVEPPAGEVFIFSTAAGR
jgi:peptidyl-prolyl cis-trans isomerase B (cyclophilin B)